MGRASCGRAEILRDVGEVWKMREVRVGERRSLALGESIMGHNKGRRRLPAQPERGLQLPGFDLNKWVQLVSCLTLELTID